MASQAGLPSGTVTLLFSDIEGSTRLLAQVKDAYAALLADHGRLLRTAWDRFGGYVIDTPGDAFFVVFARAVDAVAAAVVAQQSLAVHAWPGGARVRVRMGLHTGEPSLAGDRYVGLAVHHAARVGAAGHGGQVLLSDATHGLVQEALPDGVTVRSLGEHRLKDLGRPARLFQLVIPGLPSDFPPLKSLDGLPHNLPVQLTSFVGRERELAEIRRLLGGSRLVTLTGAGGSGKTRLALHAAADVLAEFPDGAWFVELAPLADPALVPQAIAQVLSLRLDTGGREIIQACAELLKSRRTLLVLDNCEHLVEACARGAETLLRSCPALRILVTSREVLGVPGETIYPVPPLAWPDLDRGAAPEDVSGYDAVRLFADRAAAVQPGFAVTAPNAAAIAQVCTRLDGIPLAIELAAARVRAMPVEQIAGRLADRFRLLTGGSRTVLPRHQTLRATIDWSYALLSEAERALFRRLAVFAGGFTLEAAEAMAGAAPTERDGAATPGAARGDAAGGGPIDALDTLTRLVDKSLVLAEGDQHEARYRLLETIRQYAREKLVDAGEAAWASSAHLEYFARFAEAVEAKSFRPAQERQGRRLRDEEDNLRAAIEWATESGEVLAGLRLAGALWPQSLWSGHHGWRLERLRRLLARPEAQGPSPARARALNAAAHVSWAQGNTADGRRFAEEGLAIARALSDPLATALALINLGRAATAEGRGPEAYTVMEQGVAVARESGNIYVLGVALVHLGELALSQGEEARAVALYQEVLAVTQRSGDRNLPCYVLRRLADVSRRRGDLDRAAALYRESFRMNQEIGDRRGVAAALAGLGAVALARGQAAAAARAFGAVEAQMERTAAVLLPIDRATYEASVATLRRAMTDSALAAAWAEGRAMTLEQAAREAGLTSD